MWYYNLQASGLPAGFSSQYFSFLIAARLSVTVTSHTAMQWPSTSPPLVTAKWSMHYKPKHSNTAVTSTGNHFVQKYVSLKISIIKN